MEYKKMIEPVDNDFFVRTKKFYALSLIDEFMESGMNAAKVSMEGKEPTALAQAIRHTLKRFDYPLKVMLSKGDVYLIRSDIDG